MNGKSISALVAAVLILCGVVYVVADDAAQGIHSKPMELGENVIEKTQASQFLIKFLPEKKTVIVQSPDGETRIITAKENTGRILFRATSSEVSHDVVLQMATDRANWPSNQIDLQGDSKVSDYSVWKKTDPDKTDNED